jgi:hypothetical protein
MSVSCTSPVPGGRSISAQIFEVAPIHAAKNRWITLCSMGPRHTSGLSPAQKAHGHQLHAKIFQRLDALAVSHGRFVKAHHHGHVRPVNVGIHQPDPVPESRQCYRQVHGYRGLSHAALAGTHGDKILYAGNRKFWRLWGLIGARLVGTHLPHVNLGQPSAYLRWRASRAAIYFPRRFTVKFIDIILKLIVILTN